MRNDQIEISAPIEVSATVSFWIDRDQWSAADEDTRRAIVNAELDKIQHSFDNGDHGDFYCQIIGADPAERTEYDPAKDT